ncbi:MAG TPA: serine hydrolase [Thermoanaerobaculia bacterium]|nr:serine hydrolase [Thermoanaerobaculia bacterium]
MRRSLWLLLLAAACASTQDSRVTSFERDVDELRQALHIPGMSAIIVQNQKVLWTRGFGYADVENRVPATPDTLYHIASVTKTFGSTLAMQLVEKGQLSLEEPIAKYPPSKYSGTITDERVQIRHILSHTSEGTPGDQYSYNGGRYDAITPVIEKKYGAPFRQVLAQRILDPLGMTSSVPGHNVIDDPELARRYGPALAHFAKPYTLYGTGEIVHYTYPDKGIGASAGLLSTVRDLAKFDVAIDRHVLLQPKTQELAWTPFVSNAGKPFAYGLGWFTDEYHGERLIYHSGNWGAGFSAWYLKVPAKNLSLILLANSEGLSDGFYAPDAVETNPFVCSFLRHFVFSNDDPCTGVADAAMKKWLSDRAARANAKRKVVALDAALLESYAGQYKGDETRTYTITRQGTHLFFDYRPGDQTEMYPFSEHEFFFKVPTDTVVRFIREGGAVTAMEFDYGDGSAPVRAKRITGP